MNQGGFAGNEVIPNPFSDEPGHQATGVSNRGPSTSSRLKLEGDASLQYYSLDYRTEFPVGDNPYRYYRW
jgi:hypothetical protein